MIPYIENYKNPQVGDFFMVRTVRFKRNGCIFYWPVVDKSHADSPHEQPQSHYHIDWRFMPETEIVIQRNYYHHLYPKWKELNAEYYAPIMEVDKLQEYFFKYEYLRDFDFPLNSFKHLEQEMLQKGCKMKKMKCPHHGTNLISCKSIDGVVTCPQHGLRWNVKTGELIL